VKLHAFRGQTPERWRRLGVWQPDIGNTFPVAEASPPAVAAGSAAAALDEDGVPDLLLFHRAGQDSASSSPLQAFSSKNGRLLWQAGGIRGRPGQMISRCYLLEWRDFEGTGQPDVLFAYLEGDPEFLVSSDSLSFPGGSHRLWLAKLSSRTGKGWITKVGAGFFPQEVPMNSVITEVPHLRPGLADLNDDGVLDVLVCAHGEAFKDGRRLLAINGRDGSRLWEQPQASRHFALGKLTRDGPWVVVSRGGGVHGVGSKGGADVSLKVSAWEGATGKRSWERDFKGFAAPRQEAVPLLADLEGIGTRSICVAASRPMDDRGYLLVLDARGDLRNTLEVGLTERERPSFRPWAVPIDDAGKEALVYVSQGKVRAVDGAGRLVWREEWPVPGGGDILDVLPPAPNRAALVVVRAGGAVYALDGRSGRLSYRCSGPGRPIAALPAARAGDLPAVYVRLDGTNNTVCRELRPVDAAGNYLAPAESFSLPKEEPSLSRALPWEATARRRVLLGWLPALACALLCGYWVWRRQWARVAALAVAFVGVAVVTAEWELAQSGMSFRQGLPLHAFALLLVLLYLSASAFRWWRERRRPARRRGGRLLVLCLLLVSCAALSLWRHGLQNGLARLGDLGLLLEGNYLQGAGPEWINLPVSWGGWYWVGPYVLSAAGTFGFGALFIWLVGWYLFARTTRLLRKPRAA
jgi:hypothetical protein